ncbi:phosphoglycolate phosphatase [Allohahella marinimesophila]|uniref:Phosphoglycolate phosphatase n=1 Tax=Allohahella marinimesophila TaxID=1054972 RepID=A0ABP7NH97_9GAMM
MVDDGAGRAAEGRPVSASAVPAGIGQALKDIRLVIFDLDGTLVDSVPDIAASADIMLRQMGLPSCGELAVRHAIGNGIDRLVKRLLTGEVAGEPEDVVFRQALQLFDKAYGEHLSERSTLYPGAHTTLGQLRRAGLKLCCVTNKAERFTLPLLAKLDICQLFHLVLSGDSLPRKKPDPMPLLHAAERLDVPVANSLMVGDSKHDITAAQRAGMLSIAVPYGYNHGEDIRLAEPDLLVQNLSELPALLGF